MGMSPLCYVSDWSGLGHTWKITKELNVIQVTKSYQYGSALANQSAGPQAFRGQTAFAAGWHCVKNVTRGKNPNNTTVSNQNSSLYPVRIKAVDESN